MISDGQYPERLKEPRTQEQEAELYLSKEEYKPFHMAEARIGGILSIEQLQAFVAYETQHEQRSEVFEWCSNRADELRKAEKIANPSSD